MITFILVPQIINSPLSPAYAQSNIFPDGLFNWTGWITRYSKIIPSVFILVHRLWDPSVTRAEDPLGAANSGLSGLEKDHDSIAASDIKRYKNSVNNFGTKFIVILLIRPNQSKGNI